MIQIKSILSDKDMDSLRHQWDELCTTINLPKDISERYFLDLKKHYSESHRAYHNMSHIWSLLHISQVYQKHVIDPITLQLAIWYHDIIYNPLKKNNEQKSADYFKKLFSQFLNEKQLLEVDNMIVSTAKHMPISDSHDLSLLLDFDLAILSTESSIYKAYSEAIRKEYWIYPDFLYHKGRRKVLKHFLERPQIYFNGFFREKNEKQARENLSGELNR